MANQYSFVTQTMVSPSWRSASRCSPSVACCVFRLHTRTSPGRPISCSRLLSSSLSVARNYGLGMEPFTSAAAAAAGRHPARRPSRAIGHKATPEVPLEASVPSLAAVVTVSMVWPAMRPHSYQRWLVPALAGLRLPLNRLPLQLSPVAFDAGWWAPPAGGSCWSSMWCNVIVGERCGRARFLCAGGCWLPVLSSTAAFVLCPTSDAPRSESPAGTHVLPLLLSGVGWPLPLHVHMPVQAFKIGALMSFGVNAHCCSKVGTLNRSVKGGNL